MWHDANGKITGGIITRDATSYDQWEKMHDGVIWYDTAACLTGNYIGKINESRFTPKNINRPTTLDANSNPLTNDWNGEWWTKEYAPNAYTYYNNNTYVYELADNTKTETTDYPLDGRTDTNGNWVITEVDNPRTYTLRKNAWDTQLNNAGGSIGYNDHNLYKNYLDAFLDMVEDCDLDCQANGSQLTLIAVLMGVATAVIGINAILMFVGTWRYGFRAASVYCTLFACVLQAAILIAAGALLWTKYNFLCSYSMVKTFDGMRWTMADDMQTMFTCWITSIFAMFGFLACGLCSAYRPTKN